MILMSESVAMGKWGTNGIPVFILLAIPPFSLTQWKKSLRYADQCISASSVTQNMVRCLGARLPYRSVSASGEVEGAGTL